MNTGDLNIEAKYKLLNKASFEAATKFIPEVERNIDKAR
jgi:hypothetical protein